MWTVECVALMEDGAPRSTRRLIAIAETCHCRFDAVDVNTERPSVAQGTVSVVFNWPGLLKK